MNNDRALIHNGYFNFLQRPDIDLNHKWQLFSKILTSQIIINCSFIILSLSLPLSLSFSLYLSVQDLILNYIKYLTFSFTRILYLNYKY